MLLHNIFLLALVLVAPIHSPLLDEEVAYSSGGYQFHLLLWTCFSVFIARAVDPSLLPSNLCAKVVRLGLFLYELGHLVCLSLRVGIKPFKDVPLKSSARVAPCRTNSAPVPSFTQTTQENAELTKPATQTMQESPAPTLVRPVPIRVPVLGPVRTRRPTPPPPPPPPPPVRRRGLPNLVEPTLEQCIKKQTHYQNLQDKIDQEIKEIQKQIKQNECTQIILQEKNEEERTKRFDDHKKLEQDILKEETKHHNATIAEVDMLRHLSQLVVPEECDAMLRRASQLIQQDNRLKQSEMRAKGKRARQFIIREQALEVAHNEYLYHERRLAYRRLPGLCAKEEQLLREQRKVGKLLRHYQLRVQYHQNNPQK